MNNQKKLGGRNKFERQANPTKLLKCKGDITLLRFMVHLDFPEKKIIFLYP